MKSSPKLLCSLLTLGLVAFAPTLRAAVGDTPTKQDRAALRLEKAVEARDKELTEKLSLTAEQQAKLAEIRKSGAEQLKAAVGDRAKMREIAKAQRDQVRAMLTTEQQAKFDAMPPAALAGKGKKAAN